MYALVVSAMMMALASALALQASQEIQLMRWYRANTQRVHTLLLAEGLAQYVAETGTYPATLAALGATAGYEQLRGMLDNWQGYALSAVLTDSQWQYRRAAVYALDPSRGLTASAYLAANSCGSGPFASAASWCGSGRGLWFRHESRDAYSDAVNTGRARLQRTLQKLADYYSSEGEFPRFDNAGVKLGAGSSYRLADLAGYGGSAATCSAVYLWRGVPLGCDDLFDAWGAPVGLSYTSDQAISLTSATPLTNAAGLPLLIGAGYTM